jgi:hypothetical protein
MNSKFWLAVGAAAMIAVLVGGIMVTGATVHLDDNADTLTLLVIGGAIALVAVIALIAVLYSVLGLADDKHAMGLPEGSVQAVITLLLLVLFVMLAVFFYNGLQDGGRTVTLSNQTEAQLTEFIAKHPDATNLSITVAKPSEPGPSSAPPASSAPPGSPGATAPAPVAPAPRYDISYGGVNSNASDFAKTLMAALETLLTTVIGFYFGAKTATSSAAAAAQQVAGGHTPPPTLTSVDPPSFDPSSGGTQTLKINGANLNPVVNAHVERAGTAPIPLSNVTSNPTQVTGRLAVNPAMAGSPWDVVVADGAGNMPRLKGALTIQKPAG